MLMKRHRRVGTALVAVTLWAVAQDPEVPAEFRGRWAGSENQCGSAHEGSLSIYEDRIDSYEGRGRVLSVFVVSPSEVELQIESTGEGQTWQEVRRFVLSEDGRTLTDITNARYPFSRVRCDV